MNVLESVLDVFTRISLWIVNSIQNVVPLFYNNEAGLTFLGVLCVAGLGISIVFLLIGIVQRFLKFRG